MLLFDTKNYNLFAHTKCSKNGWKKGVVANGNQRKLDIDESIYFRDNTKKRHSLIAAACEAGAASTTTDATLIENMRLISENIGIAFQIKDDLFDYGEEDIGKPRNRY